jgi:Sec-independent protein translocase protein TatA
MFDTSFLQVLVFGAVGALLVGPKDLPMVARKFGGILGKGVGVISRTRNSVQSFIRENELTHVQQDFERSLQQIRQVQDEVKQGLTSPIVSAQSIPPYTHTEYSHLSEPARAHSFPFPSNTGYPKTIVELGAPLGENPQFPYAVYVLFTSPASKSFFVNSPFSSSFCQKVCSRFRCLIFHNPKASKRGPWSALA